jgi:hypothetical protein
MAVAVGGTGGVYSPAGGGSRLEDVDNDEPVLSIGEVAKRTGVTVFGSDNFRSMLLWLSRPS